MLIFIYIFNMLSLPKITIFLCLYIAVGGGLSFFVFFFRATPTAYGSSQARGRIGAAVTSLHHSHSSARSEPHLQPTPSLQQCWILSPMSRARDQTHLFMDTSWLLNQQNHNRNSQSRKMFSRAILFHNPIEGV